MWKPSPDESVLAVTGYMESFTPLYEVSSVITLVIDLADAPAVEPAKLQAAAEGLARKWRLFAGRMEWSDKDDRWAVRVPTGELPADYKLVNFNAVESKDKCPVFFPKLSTTKNGMYPTVPDSLSYAPGTPFDFKTMAKTGAPLLNIQVSTFADFQTIGLVIQHSFQDGDAMGMTLAALNSELHGEEWTPPPVETYSRVDAAVEAAWEAVKDDPEYAIDKSIQTGGLIHGASPATLGPIIKFASAITIEKYWYKAVYRGMFVGNDIFDWVVTKAKAEAKDLTGGEEYVSTYDIAIALLFQAAYADEGPKHGPINVCGMLNLRKVLAGYGPSLTEPPLALNTVWWYSAQNYPSPHTSSLAELALFHRRVLNNIRTPAKVASSLMWLRSFRHKHFPLWFTYGHNSYMLSNQADTGMAEALDLGKGKGKGFLFFIRQGPPFTDGIFGWQKQEAGIMWTGVMRKARWASVERRLKELEEEFRAAHEVGEEVKL